MQAAHGTDYLVLDQGGHAGRASVYDDGGTLLAQAACPVATHRHGDGRVEQDAGEILASLVESIDEAIAAYRGDAADLCAAGLACQRSSVVCWHRGTGAPLTPVLSWQDTRAGAIFDEIEMDAPVIGAITGLPPVPHYGATKLAWCLRHDPAVKRAYEQGVLAWGPLASFLVYRLLEECPYVANHTIAQRTLLFDIHDCDWSQPLLDAFGIPRRSLPRCVPDRSQYGHLRAGDARVPFVVCAGDQNAVPFAFGTPASGDTCLNAGTGAFLFRMLAPGEQAGDGLLRTLVEDRSGARLFAAEGTVNGAGAAFDWLSEDAGGREVDWTRLDAMAPANDMPMFINSVGDLGSPFWRTGIAPRFVPADAPFDERVYAVAESIAFLVRANLERMPPVTRVKIAGGLSRSTLLCRMLAAVSGIEVERTADTGMTSRGVLALLSGGAASAGEPVVFNAETGLVALLDERYRKWRSLVDDAIQAP